MAKRRPYILIISHHNDAHLAFVRPFLETPTLVIDPLDVIKGTELSYRYKANELTIIYDGKPLPYIKSVWYRKPTSIRETKLDVNKAYREYCELALLAHTREIYFHLTEAFWISDFWAIQKSEHKLLQLRTAGELGFRIPDTSFTSNGVAAREFVDTVSSSIVKTSAHRFPKNPAGGSSIFFTHKVSKGSDFKYAGLHLAPAIFQQAIDYDIDIRATVVGRQVFAAAIQTNINDRQHVRDWRAAYMGGKMDIEAYELPKKVQEKCVMLVRRLGLTFGAIDLVRDKLGQLWFLEVNPNGQWAFVEQATSQPIGKAIANLLDRRII